MVRKNLLQSLCLSGPHVCPYWLAYTFDNPFRRLLHDPQQILEPYVRAGMTVLDVGCGMGYFSLALARLVGEDGRVISVDLQPKMLGRLETRAARAGLADRIQTRLCTPTDLGISTEIDFGLAFWMVHEVPDTEGFFRQIRERLKPGGSLLVAEPKIHVSHRRFTAIVAQAEEVGFKRKTVAPIRFSWSVLLGRAKS